MLPGLNIVETLELKILEVLNNARNKSGDVVLKEGDRLLETESPFDLEAMISKYALGGIKKE